ncbi:hypothetical protein C0J26_19120 [Pseudomonas baetica]|nr:hypothetical protein C0J26_19120 [Pseudomonas baetica]
MSESDSAWQSAFASRLAPTLERSGITDLCPTTIPCRSEPARDEAITASEITEATSAYPAVD